MQEHAYCHSPLPGTVSIVRKGAILLAVLCACNSLLGIDDVPEHECETTADCAGNVNRKACGQHQRCVTISHVANADPTIGATIRTEPRIAQETVVRSDLNGTALGIVCQTNHGAQAEGKTQTDDHNNPTNIPFTTWDKTDEDYWIYDWYTTTGKIMDGYSEHIDHCPGG